VVDDEFRKITYQSSNIIIIVVTTSVSIAIIIIIIITHGEEYYPCKTYQPANDTIGMLIIVIIIINHAIITGWTAW
jgi:hypothetical protein